ncbi:MAG TPA: peptide chain release factor N(5)-glutamine methyltransferase [Rhodanobacteraceae bacterium]|nr:peptide chain release factor N(5)-glutamine methyltransferase [Rhodanobacteraceae bacterium]
MTDVRAALAAGAGRLGERAEAEILLAHALGADRAWLFAHAREALEPAVAARYHALLQRRADGEPVAYLTGRRGFWTLDLDVTPATLIPRPETELLVELALERLPADRELDVADLGTGSGAIALALASERPRARVLACDVSIGALAVARGNAERLDIGNVHFAHSNWFDALAGQRFHLIASNPPYVAEGDPHLQQGDLRFEPPQALACGADGLAAIRRIIAAAPTHLHPAGWLLLEHGWEQGAAVRALLVDAGFRAISTARDLEQRERISVAQSA